MPLTPNNREEHWLQGMVDGSTDLTPNKRREYWYKEIIDAQGGGGGGGGVLIVHGELDETEIYFVLDKTWNELYTALVEGKMVALCRNETNDVIMSPLYRCMKNPSNYSAVFLAPSGGITYTCDTADDYPQIED